MPSRLTESNAVCAQQGCIVCLVYGEALDGRQGHCCFSLDGWAVLHSLPLCVALATEDLCFREASG